MQLMFRLIDPKYIVPIHGEFKMLKTSQKNATTTKMGKENIIITTNGQKVLLKNHVASLTDIFIDVTANIIDGKNISLDSEKILKERVEISNEGIFNVVLVVDKKNKKIPSNPMISTRGVMIIRDSIAMISKISYVVKDEIDVLLKSKNDLTDLDIESKVKETVKFFIWKNKKKNPLIEITIFNV